MSEHYGNLTLHGVLTIGKSITGSSDYSLPLARGSSGQVLTSDGGNGVYFADLPTTSLPSGSSGQVLTSDGGNGVYFADLPIPSSGWKIMDVGLVNLNDGTFTANSNYANDASNHIFLTSQYDAGTPGFVRVSSRPLDGSGSFTITSSSSTDYSTVAFMIISNNY